jgi:alkylresorcinol/alkylpyrone synthase
MIRFVHVAGRLKNQLARSVPSLAAEAVGELYAQRTGEPDRIITHTGGRDVIEAIEQAIPGTRLAETREVLRRYGNTSSPSVLIALQKTMDSSARHLWLSTFGAGFSAHSCELSRD